jgi:hypothetical protein
MKRYLPYIGPLIGLTGVSLALYFHAQSIQERVPTFYVGQPRAVIVDARGPTSSELQVLYRGRRVDSSVSAVTAYIWNAGKLPIRSSDVLGGPVSIELGADSEILEARVLRVSRQVVKLATGQVSDTAKNFLPLTFDILEEDDGAAIQLIYAGDPNTPVSVKGTIVGAASLRRLSPNEGQFEKRLSPKDLQHRNRLFGYSLIAMGAFLLIAASARLYSRLKQGEGVLVPTVAVACAIAYIGMGGYFLYSAHRAQSPVPAAIWSEG